jgi:hypothetical protein
MELHDPTPTPGRRRCCICRKSFRPDPRVGAGQRTCGGKECQAKLRKKTQKRWRRRHPEYFHDWRLRRLVAQVAAAAKKEGDEEAPRPPPPSRVPCIWRSLPWDLIQAELGAVPTEVLALMARLVLRLVARAPPQEGEDDETSGESRDEGQKAFVHQCLDPA